MMTSRAPTLPPQIFLSQQQARLFLLGYHFLLPPYQLEGKPGVIQVLERLGCIQFDPINVVGVNPDLVLQSRVRDYDPTLLKELLYSDRIVWDGFDKVQSIYLTVDWPNFLHRRNNSSIYQRFHFENAEELEYKILTKIRESGPLSSLELEDQTRIDGYWGFPIRIERAMLENLFQKGRLGIHHRVGTRRFFDLVENLLTESILASQGSQFDEEQFRDWHILRRVGGLGLANTGSGDHWIGILGTKTPERAASLKRLTDRGDLLNVGIEGIERSGFVMRAIDKPLLNLPNLPESQPEVTFLAPLDNLLWHRETIRKVFNFDYTWEVYTPAAKRKYGHYVLPVLYGDHFIGRVELLADKKKQTLSLRNLWWEAGIVLDDELIQAVGRGLTRFTRYSKSTSFKLLEPASADPTLLQAAKLLEI